MAPKSNDFQDELLYRQAFFHFAPHYLANRTVDKDFPGGRCSDERLQPITSPARTFPGPRRIVNGVLDWVKVNIKAKIITSQFGQVQGLHIMADWDPEIRKASTYLPEAQALETARTRCWLRERRRAQPAAERKPQRFNSRRFLSDDTSQAIPRDGLTCVWAANVGWPTGSSAGWLRRPQPCD